jgi:hypothetical protein
VLDDLIKDTHAELLSDLQKSYDLFRKRVEDNKDIPYFLELVEKMLTWNIGKITRHKLYIMLKRHGFHRENIWFHLGLFLNDIVIDHREFVIRWVDSGNTSLIVPSDDFNAQPIIVPSSNYQPEAAKVILDAMNQWELNEHNSYEYYKTLHGENQEWIGS